MKNGAFRRKLVAWLQLVRPPNLLTVPGDPVAGFLLAHLVHNDLRIGAVLPCVGASMLFYMAGLVWNDCADSAEDSKVRPERPLPRGLVKKSSALMVGGVLAVCGLGLLLTVGTVSLLVGLVLLVLIVLYDFVTKSIPYVGRLNMGLCRGASLLLGASVAGAASMRSVPVIVAAVGVTLYVSAVTAIAARETVLERIGAKRWLPLGYAAICFAVLFLVVPAVTVTSFVLAVLMVLWSAWWGSRLGGIPQLVVVSLGIAAFLKGLLLAQAVFCALTPGIGSLISLPLLLLCLGIIFLSRRFRAT